MIISYLIDKKKDTHKKKKDRVRIVGGLSTSLTFYISILGRAANAYAIY